MLDVEQWAQIRRMNVVDGISIKEIVRRTGLARNTVRAALRDLPVRPLGAEGGDPGRPRPDEARLVFTKPRTPQRWCFAAQPRQTFGSRTRRSGANLVPATFGLCDRRSVVGSLAAASVIVSRAV